MENLHIQITDELHTQIKVEAAKRGETMRVFVERALTTALAQAN